LNTKLNITREQIALFTEAIPDPALVIKTDGSILYANRNASALFERQLVNHNIFFVVRTPAINNAVTEVFSLEKLAVVQHQFHTPVPRSFDVYISPLHMIEQGASLALLVFRDLTYEEQIERMRTDFVANASHELRTPLASLSGFIETMQGAAKNDPKAKDEFLKLMKAQADRMAHLIEDLLSLSRIETSEHVAPSGTVDLTLLAKQTRDLLQDLAKNSKCDLKLEMPNTLPVIGDAGQLSQVIYNLVENAIKYAGSNKSVILAGRAEGNTAIFTVQDFGQGIAAHHIPRLTERFYRVSAQDSRMRGGTGLGLAIAKHILKRHRGKSQIESKLGEGSTFSIHIPAVISEV
jgi:two-component system, OmpR family, phosphate regulon sensor histidine kinase PhoR